MKLCAENGTGFVLWQYKNSKKKIAMKNNINKKAQVSLKKGEIWNIKVGFFLPALLIDKDIPTESLDIKFKIVLN